MIIYKNIEINYDPTACGYFVEGSVSNFEDIKVLESIIDDYIEEYSTESDPDYIMGVDEYIDNTVDFI